MIVLFNFNRFQSPDTNFYGLSYLTAVAYNVTLAFKLDSTFGTVWAWGFSIDVAGGSTALNSPGSPFDISKDGAFIGN